MVFAPPIACPSPPTPFDHSQGLSPAQYSGGAPFVFQSTTQIKDGANTFASKIAAGHDRQGGGRLRIDKEAQILGCVGSLSFLPVSGPEGELRA